MKMKLEELLEISAPLPLSVIDKGKAANGVRAFSIGSKNGHITYIFDDKSMATLIVHAVNMLPKLVDELRNVTQKLVQLAGTVKNGQKPELPSSDDLQSAMRVLREANNPEVELQILSYD